MFDIHGGGIDLVFPHHENEVAQSRCANATPIMAQVWMHNGFLQVEGEKMAKSAGNFVTVHELLETKKFGSNNGTGMCCGSHMLMTHYQAAHRLDRGPAGGGESDPQRLDRRLHRR